jgi:hypothetical protein
MFRLPGTELRRVAPGVWREDEELLASGGFAMRDHRNKARALAGALAIGCCATAPAVAAGLPSYATNVETIRGTISALTGKYTLSLADERGFTDSVTLREGTTIQPSGVELQVGEPVVITGHTSGPTFLADEIDSDTANDTGAGDASYDYGYAGDAYAPYDTPYPYGYGYFSAGFGIYGYPGYYGSYPCCYYGGGRGGPWRGHPGYPPGGGHHMTLPQTPLRAPGPSGPRSSGGISRSSGGGSRR